MPRNATYLLVDHAAGHRTLHSSRSPDGFTEALAGMDAGHEWTIFELVDGGSAAGTIREGTGPG
jgi:hypothetical protein